VGRAFEGLHEYGFFMEIKNPYQNRMTAPPISQEEVLRQIDKVKEYAHAHQNQLPNAIYNAMDGFSRTFLAHRQNKDLPTTEDGTPLWGEEQQTIVKEALPMALQTGGALQAGDLKFGPQSDLVKSMQPIDFSLDKMAENVKQYLASIDEKNRELASIIGPVAMIKQVYPGGDVQVGPFYPYLPAPVSIPTNTLLVLINAILEACRLLVSNTLVDIPILRQILSFVLSMYDILRGEWRDGVMSFMGFFSQSWMIYGIIGKTARWVYNFIAPDIQQRLETDMYAGFKSMLLGYWLWVASIVSPSYVRLTIQNLIDTAKQPLEQVNETLASLEAEAQKSAAAIGAQVKFPRLPLENLPSFDDIQNFQTLLHQPELYCSPAFRAALEPALAIPVLRLVFELLNIPTTPEAFADACKGQPASVAEAITEQLAPTVTIPGLQEQIGGRKALSRRNRKKARRTRKKSRRPA
jgi:hypothetical protein